MVGVRKAHPHEPVFVIGQGVQPIHSALGDPVGVIQLGWYVGWPHLYRAGIAAGNHVFADPYP